MQLARVIGNVVATVKNDLLEGRKLLVIQPLAAFEQIVLDCTIVGIVDSVFLKRET